MVGEDAAASGADTTRAKQILEIVTDSLLDLSSQVRYSLFLFIFFFSYCFCFFVFVR
jgi:hypothetical protein